MPCATTDGYDADVKLLRVVLIALGLLVVAAAAWLWWARPQQVEMATYVPQDTLLYLEADSLPDIVNELTSTSAWHTLAPAAGVRENLPNHDFLLGLAKWTGIGSAEAVIYSRAQVAVAVLGVDAKEERESALQISPRLVIVVETQTSEARIEKALRSFVGDFARRNYGDPKFERSEHDGATFLVWAAPEGGRKIVAAVNDTVAYVGNDEDAVKACLDVRRGARPSLAADPELAPMRRRVGADDALAFGYVPRAGTPKLAQIAALVAAGQSSAGAKEQSALA
ncbi:MAG: hypothetical protein M3268_07620, partial [Acidobacteriota bacterium]|nr:hypothetical protein [Acidobacteriota bacterium]